MTNTGSFETLWTPRLLSILRIIAGFLFIAHGTQKLFNYPASVGGVPPLMSLAGAAGILEVVGGLLIILGLFTRSTAFILSGLMAVGYFLVHAPGGLLPIVNKGELAVLFCFLFLYMSAAGGGVWGLDHLLSQRKRDSLMNSSQRETAAA